MRVRYVWIAAGALLLLCLIVLAGCQLGGGNNFRYGPDSPTTTSTAPGSATRQYPAPVIPPSASTTMPRSSITDRILPTQLPPTSRPTTITPPPLFAPVDPRTSTTSTAITPTTRPTTRPTTTQQAAPISTAPATVGTIDSFGREERCAQGGIQVIPGRSVSNNGVTFKLDSRGPNGTPRLSITGSGSYTYSDTRIVTGSDVFTGHVNSSPVPVSAGQVNSAYDLLVVNGSLQGVIVCL